MHVDKEATKEEVALQAKRPRKNPFSAGDEADESDSDTQQVSQVAMKEDKEDESDSDTQQVSQVAMKNDSSHTSDASSSQSAETSPRKNTNTSTHRPNGTNDNKEEHAVRPSSQKKSQTMLSSFMTYPTKKVSATVMANNTVVSSATASAKTPSTPVIPSPGVAMANNTLLPDRPAGYSSRFCAW